MPDYIENEIEEWYTQYHQTIFKYVLLMVKDYQQAEDLTHETFVKAFKYHHTFKRDSTVKTWLFTIAHNLTIDYLRKKKTIRLFKQIFNSREDSAPLPDQIVQLNESVVELYKALGGLKNPYREVIILRKIKGFSISETSKILNWSEGKVKATLFRALPALEEQLKKEWYKNEETK
ncbi:RNA polymerase sigma factor [Litchfieldia salsa]|uniref:RNA polymerase sigma-70 factor, ECF subfamily n=1 Tax=Litchfieldia salsa TaxID=930152 RepID=A0A1H0SXY5_9BACI|nr:RNA polymerase sigma factor [Litchfieldia salsa]SDP46742.1 RNA polymerase sigma-70 factor, ECF subfamily [Litchfieldia salsa]